MTAARVSVVMPFKDAAPFLAEAVDSVMAQTWAPVELLLVDDGGRDGSHELAAALAADAPSPVRVLHHPGRANLGTSAARSLGVQEARGDLIAFLDADDRWDPGHLAHEVALLHAHPEAAFVCGRAWRWSSWQDARAVDVLTPLAFAPGVVVPPPRLLAAVLRQGALTTPTCSLLVRSEALRGTGGPPTGFGSLYEDQVVNTLLQLRLPAVVSGATSAWYRQHEASATALAIRDGSYHPVAASASRRRFLQWLDGLPELQVGAADPEVRELLDVALRSQTTAPQGASRAAAAAVGRRLMSAGVRRRTDALLRRRGLARLRLASLLFAQPVAAPASRDRGVPVDRSYVESFLRMWAEDVHGRVLEAGDSSCSARFGRGRVDRADVLNPRLPVEGTSYTGTLEDGAGLPGAAFDCVILTDELHRVFDVHAAVVALRRLLKPGGVLLVTVPGISGVSEDDEGTAWQWSFTRHSVARLFQGVFGVHEVEVLQYGNALAATAGIQGLAAEELSERALRAYDARFPVLLAVRAVRPVGAV